MRRAWSMTCSSLRASPHHRLEPGRPALRRGERLGLARGIDLAEQPLQRPPQQVEVAGQGEVVVSAPTDRGGGDPVVDGGADQQPRDAAGQQRELLDATRLVPPGEQQQRGRAGGRRGGAGLPMQEAGAERLDHLGDRGPEAVAHRHHHHPARPARSHHRPQSSFS